MPGCRRGDYLKADFSNAHALPPLQRGHSPSVPRPFFLQSEIYSEAEKRLGTLWPYKKSPGGRAGAGSFGMLRNKPDIIAPTGQRVNTSRPEKKNPSVEAGVFWKCERSKAFTEAANLVLSTCAHRVDFGSQEKTPARARAKGEVSGHRGERNGAHSVAGVTRYSRSGS